MAALNVSVLITEVTVSQAQNNYSCTAILAAGDVSGLTNFQLSWTGPGQAPRYAPGATGTITLP